MNDKYDAYKNSPYIIEPPSADIPTPIPNSPYIIEPPSADIPGPPPVSIVAQGELENFGSWTLYTDGLLSIDGVGDMPDWDRWKYIYAPWYKYSDAIKAVALSAGVAKIGNWAFWCSKSLTSVTIPNSVTTIGKNAFCHCTNLTSITIPNSVTTIGTDAFRGCTSLTSVTMPKRFKPWFFKRQKFEERYGISLSYVTFV